MNFRKRAVNNSNDTKNIIVIQPALPSYRIPFFSGLSEHFGSSFKVYAADCQELNAPEHMGQAFHWAHSTGNLIKFWPSVFWQRGIVAMSVQAGDILVIAGEPRNISSLFLLVRAKLIGAKTIWWGHFWSSTSRSWRANIRFKIMMLADAILFYTEQEVQLYASSVAPQHKCVRGINNGLDTQAVGAFRENYEPATRQRDLLFIGRLTEKARLSIVLHALCDPTCVGVRLDVIGTGSMVGQLKSLAIRLGLSDRVVWHGTVTEEREIAKIANDCRAFVYPGAVGLSLIHGFAYGLPAIVHNKRSAQMPEIAAFIDKENGGSFIAEDPNSLAKSISALLSCDDNLRKMSKNALSAVKHTFNTEDMNRRFIKLIDEIRS